MDERRGAWGQLLAVFRLIHDGHEGWVARRGGKLFDPDAFPFLEGREKGSARDDGRTLTGLRRDDPAHPPWVDDDRWAQPLRRKDP